MRVTASYLLAPGVAAFARIAAAPKPTVAAPKSVAAALARWLVALARIAALRQIAALRWIAAPQWIAVLPRITALLFCACLPAAAPADTATVELSDRAFSRFFHINGNLDHHIRSLSTWNVPGYYCIGFEYPNKAGDLEVIAQIRARTQGDEAEYRRLVDLIPQIMASPHAQGMIEATGLPDPSTAEFTAFFDRKFASLYKLLDEVEAAIRATPERDCGLTDQQLARADVYPPSYRTVPDIVPPGGPLCPDDYWEALDAVARARADAEYNAFLAHKYLVAIRDARRAGLASPTALAVRESEAKADIERWDAKVAALTALHAQIKATPIKDCSSGETSGGETTGGGATGGGTPPGQQPMPPAGPGGDPGVRLHEPKIIEAPAPGEYTVFCSEFDRNVAIAAAEKAATAASHNSRQWLIRLDDIRSALLHHFGNADVLRQHRAHAQAQIRYWNEIAAKANAAAQAYKRIPITQCELDQYWTHGPVALDWQPPGLSVIDLIEWPQDACALTPDQQALLDLQAHQAEHAAARAVSAVAASLASFLASVRDGARVAAAMITGQAIIDGLDETTRRNAEGRQRFAESVATCPNADPATPGTGTTPPKPVPPKTGASVPGTGTGGATGGVTTGGGTPGAAGGGATGGGVATSGNRATVVTPPLTQSSRAATQCKPCQPIADEYNDLVAQHEAQKRAIRRYREAQQLIDGNRARLEGAKAATSDQAEKKRLQDVMDNQAGQRELYQRDIQKAQKRMTELEAQMKATLGRLRECEETCRRQVAQGLDVGLVPIVAPWGPRLGVPPLAGKVITVCLACQPQAVVYNAIVESINAVIVEIGHEAQLYAQSTLNREAAWRRYNELMREWEALEADLDQAYEALVACEEKCKQASNTIEPKAQWACSVKFKSFEEFRQWRRDFGSLTPAWEFSTGWMGDGSFHLEAQWAPTIRLIRQFDVELPGSQPGTGGAGGGGSTAPGTGFYPRPRIEDDLNLVPEGSGTKVRPWPRFEYIDGVLRPSGRDSGVIRIEGAYRPGGSTHEYRMDPRDLFGDEDDDEAPDEGQPFGDMPGHWLPGSALADPVWVPDASPFGFLGYRPVFDDPDKSDESDRVRGVRLRDGWLLRGNFRYGDWKPLPGGSSDRVSGHANEFLIDGIRLRPRSQWQQDDEDDEEGRGPIYFLGPIETGYTNPIGVIPNAGFRPDRTIRGQGSGFRFRYQVQDTWNLNDAWQFNAQPDEGSAPAIDTRGWKIDSRYVIDPELFKSLYGDQSSWSPWDSKYESAALAGFAVAPGFKPSLPAYVDDAAGTRMQVFTGDDRHPPAIGVTADELCRVLNGRPVAIDEMADEAQGDPALPRTAIAIRQHDGAWSPEALLEGRRAPWGDADANGSPLVFVDAATQESLAVPSCPKPDANANPCTRKAGESLASLGKDLDAARRSLQSLGDLHEIRGRVVDRILTQRQQRAGAAAVSDAQIRAAGDALAAAQESRAGIATLEARAREAAQALMQCPASGTAPTAGASCAVTLSLIAGSTETTYLLDASLSGEDADTKRLARWLLEHAVPHPRSGPLRLHFAPGEHAARQGTP